MTQKNVAVIGGGLGGISAAISLANRGYQVDLFEKNSHLGGKLNTKSIDGFTFDLGPSILTLPHIFKRLFDDAGKKFEDYCRIYELDLHWRNFFEDGMVFDFYKSRDKTRRSIQTHFPEAGAAFDAYLEYCIRQYHICRDGYFDRGIDSFTGMFRGTPLRDLLLHLDIYRSMHRTNTAYFGDTPLRDAFDYFIKYVGSSALDAPGFMNLLAGVQFEEGLWYVEGGLFSLSRALKNLAQDTGVRLHTETEVTALIEDGRKVRGVRVEGNDFPADHIISNMEVIPALRKLSTVKNSAIKKLSRRFPPACSGVVVHLGVDREYPNLGHHNFFYSRNQADHFRRVFRKKQLPDDPTLYVVAVTRTDRAQAPAGCENIKILPHIPPLDEKAPLSPQEYTDLMELSIDKLERMGCPDLRKHIVVRDQWSPWDIQEQYYSHRGAIYGVESNHLRNFALKAPKKSRNFDNLWFVGGSTNPGGGMPMAVLSGINAAQQLTGEMKIL
jgi:diapolycopene oxygenase